MDFVAPKDKFSFLERYVIAEFWQVCIYVSLK